MDTQLCKNCKYFQQHYGLGKQGLFRLYCGHCTLSRPKNKQPDQKACAEFAPGENKEQAFASKEYLSRALLDRLMNLELLPRIQEKNEL